MKMKDTPRVGAAKPQQPLETGTELAPPTHNATTTPDDLQTVEGGSVHATKVPKTWRFWAIIASLGVAGLASAIEGTIITSALPTITADLGGGDLYVWVPNAYLLASVAVLPLFGQASDIFGRRGLLLSAVALFTLGKSVSQQISKPEANEPNRHWFERRCQLDANVDSCPHSSRAGWGRDQLAYGDRGDRYRSAPREREVYVISDDGIYSWCLHWTIRGRCDYVEHHLALGFLCE